MAEQISEEELLDLARKFSSRSRPAPERDITAEDVV